MVYNYSEDGKSIVSVTITTTTMSGNTCEVPVPITVPGRASSDHGLTDLDLVGSEPAIYWTDLSGSPVTLTLSPPVLL